MLLPYMERVWPACICYPTRHHELIQKFEGDVLVLRGKSAKYVEFKCEEENKHGNLFIETWSNLSRENRGWYYKCQASWLWYYFIDDDELYCVEMDKLRRWGTAPGRSGDCHLFDFPERQQRKREQKNDTWGRCVPIETLSRECEGFCGPKSPRSLVL